MEVCPHCNSVLLEIKEKGPHIGLYCTLCFKHIRWIKKSEKSALQSKINLMLTSGRKYAKRENKEPQPEVISTAKEEQPVENITEETKSECEYCCDMPEAIKSSVGTRTLEVDFKAKELRIKEQNSSTFVSFPIKGCPICLRRF